MRGPNTLGCPAGQVVDSRLCARNCILFSPAPKFLIPRVAALNVMARCDDRLGAEMVFTNRRLNRVRNYFVRRKIMMIHVQYSLSTLYLGCSRLQDYSWMPCCL